MGKNTTEKDKSTKKKDKRLVELGKRLQAARNVEPKVSQADLAKKIDYHVNTIRNWEQGGGECTKHDALEWYSEHSKYTIDYLRGLVDGEHDTLFDKDIATYQDDTDLFISFVNRFTDYTIARQGMVFDLRHKTKDYVLQPALLFDDFEKVKAAITKNISNTLGIVMRFALKEEEHNAIENKEIDPWLRSDDIRFAPASDKEAFNIELSADNMPESLKEYKDRKKSSSKE